MVWCGAVQCGAVQYYLQCDTIMPFYRRFWCDFYCLCGLCGLKLWWTPLVTIHAKHKNSNSILLLYCWNSFITLQSYPTIIKVKPLMCNNETETQLYLSEPVTCRHKRQTIKLSILYNLYIVYCATFKCCTIIDVRLWLERVGDEHLVIATQQLWEGQCYKYAT